MKPLFDSIVSHLSAFLRYLVSLWGIMSAFAAFFPLVDQFRRIIPPPDGRAGVCTLLATLAGLAVILNKFVNRRVAPNKHPSLRPFFVAIFVTLFYTFIVPAIPTAAIQKFFLQGGTSSIEPPLINVVWACGRLISGALYIFIFYKFTDCFTTLAVHEWRLRVGS
jgi:hypothetical protein